MKSPLSSLCEVIRSVRTSSKTYHGKLENNEALTRTVLIDPVLMALGWDIKNPAMVELEHSLKKHKGNNQIYIDYVLAPEEEKKVLVEAKKLGEKLDEHFLQLCEYASSAKSENIYITDGLRWHHYKKLVVQNPKPERIIDLNDESMDVENAAYLVSTLDAAFLVPDLTSEDEKLKEAINELKIKVSALEKKCIATSANQETEQNVQEVNIDQGTTKWLSLLDTSWVAKGKKPQQYRLPNNDTVSVSSWSQVLVESCEYAFSINSDLINQLPIATKANGVVKLVSQECPPANVNFDTINVNGETLYVFTNFSATACVANSAHILEKIPKSEWKAEPALKLRE